VIVIDPWGVQVVCRGVSWDSDELAAGPGGGGLGPYRSAPGLAGGSATQEIKIWGRRRLLDPACPACGS
jgi:hypothetical protein